MVSEALDSYPLYVMSNGWKIQGENQTLNVQVEEWLNTFDFDNCIRRLIVDSMVNEFAFQEIIPTRGGGLHSIKPCPSWTFEIEKDEYGRALSFVQYKDDAMFSKNQKIDPNRLIVFDWVWLMHRAFDDITRDTKAIDGISEAILRHGFPKMHIQVGAEGEHVGENVISAIGQKFRSLKPGMDFTTVRGVDIKNVDQGGVQNAAMYNDVMVQRVCSAMGVPEEILGLGRGSTEATANVRLQAFYDKISTLQKAVSRAYNRVIDMYTGRPGECKLVFNDVSPVDENMKMDFIQKAAMMNPIDPEFLMSRTEMRDYMGFEADNEDADYEPVTLQPEEIPPEERNV